MNSAKPPTADFDQRYQTHLKHLKLKSLQRKTIDAYARAIRNAPQSPAIRPKIEHKPRENLSACCPPP